MCCIGILIPNESSVIQKLSHSQEKLGQNSPVCFTYDCKGILLQQSINFSQHSNFVNDLHSVFIHVTHIFLGSGL